jgi:hypothetical protein
MARGRFTFWLDFRKDDELVLAETIDDLKRKRGFASAIRDGLRLIVDLRAGQLDVLFELFPWVQVEFLKHLESIQPQKSEPELQLQRQLDRLERLMFERGYVPEQGRRSLPSRPELPRSVEAPPVEYDGNASENFLNAFF